jgi:trehalose synthase
MRAHLQPLPVGRRRLADYVELAAEERIRAAAEPLRGARVLHLSAAGSRLRYPEALPALQLDLGIEAGVAVVAGDRALRRLVRELEDGLQGAETAISDDAWSAYREVTNGLAVGWDVVIAHGPGPLGAGASLVRFPVDASKPDPAAWERLRPLVERCAAPATDYAPPGIDAAHVPEAIDPLAPGCVDLPVPLAGSMLRSLGVDTSRPCCCQLRPFDSWQDPQDVLDAFELAKAELPQLQLVLAGEEAEAWGPLREVFDYAREQDDVLLLMGVGDVELNALRQISRVALESALAATSALTTLETLWKRTPVISAGRRGSAHPVRDGVDGCLVDTPEAAGERLVELVRDPSLGIELGASGHELVRERFLVTRLLEDELELVTAARAATLQSP